MVFNSHSEYKFDHFRIDVDRTSLYFHEELIREVEKKSVEVLTVLLRTPNQLVSHDEIIDEVWRDSRHGVTPARINQYISKLQKVFEKYDPERRFIENVRGRGYIFKGEVVLIDPSATNTANSSEVDRTATSEQAIPRKVLVGIIALASVALILLIITAWAWLAESDHKEVERVVKESQFYESLVVYKNPTAFTEADLDRYWTHELDVNSNYDRGKIRQAVAKLVAEGRRYGDETKCELFDFESVEINSDGDMAVVKTLEKWFTAVYSSDGKLVRNRTIGPYFVSYVLRKSDGRWLIEKSNTGRATPAAPKLKSVEAMTTPGPGRQFFVRIIGEDLLGDIVHLKIVGEGCPESSPCEIPNRVLLESSKITPSTIESIPLTLASGEFKLYAQNGDSKLSNPVKLSISPDY